MSLFDDASLVMIPSGYKEDTVYSVKPTDGSGDLTFTRASDGTRVNSAGYVENVPWNLVQYSEQFTQYPPWLIQNITRADNVTTAPNGTTTAGKIYPSTTSYNPVLYSTVISVVSGQNYAVSIYAKAAGKNWIFIRTVADSSAGVWFNLSTGAIGTQTSATGTIESVGNGWYRCTVIGAPTTTSGRCVYLVVDGDGSTTGTASGTDGIYLWGAQLNTGSTAKPYFPTTDRLNVPRLDYSNGCPSLLLEPQRTNLVTYSENFSTWTTIGSPTITSNYGTSPSGIQNSTRIQGVSGDRIYLAISGTSATYTYSIYAKGSGTFKLRENTDTYNLSITPTSNWVRYDFSFTAAFSNIQIQLTSTCDIEIWGAQVEAGSYATSYIPTTSASVTRVADAASKTGISSLIGQSEGTLFFDGYCNNNAEIISINRSTTNSVFLYSANNNVRGFVYSDGTGINLLSSVSCLTRFKAAVAYKSNSIAFYVNGTLIAQNTVTTFTPNITMSDVYIAQGGYVSGKQQVNCNQAIIFPTRLTNAELASLTTL